MLPRETKLDTTLSDSIHLSLPIISSDMDTVTESQMAIGMARNGGMGLIHCNMSQKEQLVEVARVKNYIHGLIQEPIKVSPDMLIGDVLKIVSDKNFRFRTFPVVDSSNRLVGLLPGSIVKERYAALSVAKAMTPRAEVFTVSQKDLGSDPIAVADAFFDEHFGVHKLLVVDDDDKLRGLFTLKRYRKDFRRARQAKENARDSKFRLLCGASIAMIRKPDGSWILKI
ncbi:MAG: IMP dehydrogenase [Bacilli bacterium]